MSDEGVTNEVHRFDVVEHSIESFTKEVVRLTLDGFAISATNPGDSIGFGNCYTVSMFRDESTVARLKQLADGILSRPKMTRSEVLAKAREAKDAKAQARLDVGSVLEYHT